MGGKRSAAVFMFIFSTLLSLSNMLPKHSAWRIAVLVAMLANTGFMMRSYLKGDPELKAQRKRDLRHREIRALEKELGFEPLELDWPEPMLDSVKKENEK